MINKYNPKWAKLAQLYKMNGLAFAGEYELKNSPEIVDILLPTTTMTDSKNPAGDYLWTRYSQQALYTNYPQKYLKQAIGLASKGKPEVKLPQSMSKLIDYATLQNTDLQSIEMQMIDGIVKYGSCLVRVHIPDEAQIAKDTPKLEVIDGSHILDADSKYNNDLGLDMFTRVVYYDSENKFNPQSKSYDMKQIYIYILGLDSEGSYYTAKMIQQNYSKFNLQNPTSSLDMCQWITYPKWINEIGFIPAVYINKDNLKLDWKQSPIQNLIDTSLSIFQLNADIRMLLHQQGSATLVIAGADMDGKSVKTGLGAVLNLVESGSSASYIAPSVAGLNAMRQMLNDQHLNAKNDLLNLIDAGSNSSGEALNLRISDKTNELRGMVEVIGKGIQRILEYIANIMEQSIDQVVFIPDTEFANVSININNNSEMQ